MFVKIGKVDVNMDNVETIDEGTGGQLRLLLVSGKAVIARTAEEIAAVREAKAHYDPIPHPAEPVKVPEAPKKAKKTQEPAQ
jgi:hypothetical protein